MLQNKQKGYSSDITDNHGASLHDCNSLISLKSPEHSRVTFCSPLLSLSLCIYIYIYIIRRVKILILHC